MSATAIPAPAPSPEPSQVPVRVAGPSPLRAALSRAVRRPLVIASLAWLFLLFAGCALASVISPYDPLTQDLNHPLEGPTGAHLLGLDAENFAMFRHFARSATPARKWFPIWAFHFDGRIAALDYHNDEHFVREIPAVFDLCYRAL